MSPSLITCPIAFIVASIWSFHRFVCGFGRKNRCGQCSHISLGLSGSLFLKVSQFSVCQLLSLPSLCTVQMLHSISKSDLAQQDLNLSHGWKNKLNKGTRMMYRESFIFGRCNYNEEYNSYAEMRISNSIGFEMSRDFQFSTLILSFQTFSISPSVLEVKLVGNELSWNGHISEINLLELCFYIKMKFVKEKETQEKKNQLPSRAPIRRSERSWWWRLRCRLLYT